METTWQQAQSLADKLIIDPLAGMDVLADLCSHLTTLTRETLAEHKLAIDLVNEKYNTLAGQNHATRLDSIDKAVNELANLTNAALAGHTTSLKNLASGMLANSQSLATLLTHDSESDAHGLDYVRSKLAELQTQISELFGGPPGKLSQRIDSLHGDLRNHAKEIDDIQNRLNSLTHANNETVLNLADHKADPKQHPPA